MSKPVRSQLTRLGFLPLVIDCAATMGDIYRAALPFLGCDAIVMALLIAFPTIALWLPSVMR